MRPQVLAQFRRLLLEVFVHTFERAVPGDEPRRRLLPHPRHPRQVVGGVATQRRILGIGGGCHAVSLLDPSCVGAYGVGDAAPGVDHGDPGFDELEDITIAGHDDGLPPLLESPRGERGDDVVGFDPGHGDLGDLQRLEHLVDEGELGAEQIGR